MKTIIDDNSIQTLPKEELFPIQKIEILVSTQYIEEQSNPSSNQYVYSYTIRIINRGESRAKLLRRHWIITDANGETLEVRGAGVVGEQPWIESGSEFKYTSGTVLNDSMGCMQGSYTMCNDDGDEFEVEIPVFTLAQSNKLH